MGIGIFSGDLLMLGVEHQVLPLGPKATEIRLPRRTNVKTSPYLGTTFEEKNLYGSIP